MSPEVYSACSEYLERLGAAEYKQHCATFRKLKKKPAFSPSEYMRKLVEYLGKRDENAFKSLKAEQGYSSALGS